MLRSTRCTDHKIRELKCERLVSLSVHGTDQTTGKDDFDLITPQNLSV